MGSHRLTCHPLGSLGFTLVVMKSKGFKLAPIGSLGLKYVQLVSLRLTLVHRGDLQDKVCLSYHNMELFWLVLLLNGFIAIFPIY